MGHKSGIKPVKFVTVRDLRGKTSELWKELEQERELVVTSNGKPIAILSATDEYYRHTVLLLPYSGPCSPNA